MNNINTIIEFINENGGSATVDDILNLYVKNHHVLFFDENKQKIKSTLIEHNGSEVFLDGDKITWRTKAENNVKTTTISAVQSNNSRNGVKASLEQIVEYLSSRFQVKQAYDHIEFPTKKSNNSICYYYYLRGKKIGNIYYLKGRDEKIQFEVNEPSFLPEELRNPAKPLPGFAEVKIRDMLPRVVMKFYSFNAIKDSLELICNALDNYFGAKQEGKN